MKRYYRAMARITDGSDAWDVVIYSFYKTREEAITGINNFAKHGYHILKAWIE